MSAESDPVAPSDAPDDDASVPDEAVRLALELAFGVAVLGSRQRPPLPVPAGLRPFLRFQKLPPAALAPLRRAVEADEAFRSRVAAVADESIVGRAGALWLRRPAGWAAELSALAPPDDGADARRDRAEAARIERAERAAARAVAEAAVLSEALTAERERQAAERMAARAQSDASVDELRARADEAERAAGAAAVAREVAERRLVDADRTRTMAERRADELAARVAALEAERAALTGRVEAAERAAAAAQAAQAAVTAAPPVAAPAAAGGDRDHDLARRLAPIVGDAAATVVELGRVLGRLGAELDGRGTPRARPQPPTRPPVTPAVPARSGPSPSSVVRPAPAGPARVAVALPPRTAVDSVEAAAFLLRRPGAVVLVDGYNVAKVAFPAARSLADERDWLADVLDELSARLCGDVRVVFDGADVPPVPSRRRAAQVLFSPAGVTADDILVELVNTVAVDRPVVVATNDLALRERVKVYGANVLSCEQLLAAARR